MSHGTSPATTPGARIRNPRLPSAALIRSAASTPLGRVAGWRSSGRASVSSVIVGGRGGGTRTRDLVLPKHVRYQATLLPAESALTHVGEGSGARKPNTGLPIRSRARRATRRSAGRSNEPDTDEQHDDAPDEKADVIENLVGTRSDVMKVQDLM